MSRRLHLIVIAVALATAVASTWPVAAHLRDGVVAGARLSDPPERAYWNEIRRADVFLTLWILNWNLHALVTQPLRLFDANIFYPAPLSLARAEHMFATSLLGAPGAVLGEPVLAHQIALLLTVALNVWLTAYVITRWTASLVGGLVAGILFAVSPFHQSVPFHLQSLGTAYFAPMLFALERFGATGRVRWAAAGALALTFQMLSGQYLAYYTLIVWTLAGGVTLVVGRPAEHRLKRMLYDGAWLAVASAGAALLVLPFALPYLRLSGLGELPNNLAANEALVKISSVASLREYIVGGRGSPTTIPPGTWVLGAAGTAALLAGRRAERTRAIVLLLIGVAGALLSLGPKPAGLGVYGACARLIPGFPSMRVTFRAVVIPHLASAMLAGCGAAALVAWLPRAGPVVAIGLLAVSLVSSWEGPIPLRRLPVGEAVPPAYRFLARCGEGHPLLEVPVAANLDPAGSAAPMFFSTFHWLPLLNGWAGYPPPLFEETSALAARLPEPEAVSRLRELTGLRWVLVHCGGMWGSHPHIALLCAGRASLGAWSQGFGDMRLYDLGPPPALPRAWPRPRPAAADCPRGARDGAGGRDFFLANRTPGVVASQDW